MKKLILSISLFLIVLFSISGIALPWEIKTHEEISENAINISVLEQYCEDNLGFSFSSKIFQGPSHSVKRTKPIEQFSDDKNYTTKEWISHGSGAEDEFFDPFSHLIIYLGDMRPVNHYYNPFWNNSVIYPYPNDDWGNDWLFQQGGLYDDLFNDIPLLPLGISMGKPSPRWAYDGCPDTPPNSDFTRTDDNYFSWIYARKYFYAALSGDSTEIDGVGGIEGKMNMNENERDRCFALLFRSLGQLIHLVQDAGQPEHTRNDGHPLNSYSDKIPFFEGFENYASKHNFNDPTWATVIPWSLVIKTENPDNPIYDFFASDHSGSADYSTVSSTGIAEFSSYNFLTKDSIADNLMHDYCEPDCEPHGHERHRFFTHPRINENSSTLEEGFIYDTHYYWSEQIADPLGISPSQSVRLAKRKWYHNLLLLYGWRDYTTEDKKVWDDYLKLLIPKCVGYSAALLDYFFRGVIEISLSDTGVYALTDKDPSITDTDDPRYIEDPASDGFDRIQFYAQNTSPDGEEMSNGTVTLVVKYRLGQGNQFQNPPAATSLEFHYITKEIPDVSIPRDPDPPTLFDIDLSDSQIPLWATDVYLYLVYKGQLGSEAEAVAVGFKDISEPTMLSYYNSMDKICIHGVVYDAGSPEAIAAVDEGEEDEWDVYPHDRENVYIKYSSNDNPQSLTPSFDNYNYKIPYQAAGEYMTMFILTDYWFAVNSSDGEIVATDDNDNFDHYIGNYIGGVYIVNAIKNQIEADVRHISQFNPFRDILNSWFVNSLVNPPLPEGSPDCSY